jgi:hypothetical protein
VTFIKFRSHRKKFSNFDSLEQNIIKIETLVGDVQTIQNFKIIRVFGGTNKCLKDLLQRVFYTIFFYFAVLYHFINKKNKNFKCSEFCGGWRHLCGIILANSEKK